MKKTVLLLLVALTTGLCSYAQEGGDTVATALARINSDIDAFKRLKISGYLQPQYQVADSAGIPSFAGGNFTSGTSPVDKRFMLRRARLKFVYDTPINDKGWSTSQYVLQFDISEKGVVIKDVYAKITDPWTGWFSVTGGMQNRPFGFEIGYSSSLRESPERGRMSQIIFPNERDLGGMLTIQGPKLSRWNWIKLEAGMFNGTGGPSTVGQFFPAGNTTPVFGGSNTSDFDSYKDFIGHLTVSRTNKSEKVAWAVGVSMYDGGYRIDTVNVYKSATDSAGVAGFTTDIKKSDNMLISDYHNRGKAERKYMGADAQVSIEWAPGITTLRAEYIQGEQPGTSSSTTSPASQVFSDIYKRKFNGAYFYFLQNIGQLPWQVIVKYDWYDPNTDVQGDDLGKSVQSTFKKTNGTDVKYTTLGLGLAYRWDSNVKITAYYDNVKNETSSHLSGFTKDIPDNVFTLRMQYKF